ncbi:MAG: glycosyltransferase family A protein [Anaerolineales bacterium]
MRVGQNPIKSLDSVATPAPITVAVLSYAPFLSGYWAESLEVLKACLESLRQTSDRPHDLMVFDNGSCPDVVEFLVRERTEGRIQFLILSDKNLGKGGAWNVLFQAAAGDVIAYTDCDALFSPGWLSRSLEILETFPRVGMVTSRPFRTPPEFYRSTVDWARATPEATLEEGQFIPWPTFREFDLSLGQDEADVRRRYEATRDIRVTYRGVRAHAGASHYQFVARRSVLAEFLPFTMDRPMGQVRQLDRLMNEAGYLRLMTPEPFLMNMSNSLRPVPRESLAHPAGSRPGPSLGRRILGLGIVRRPLLAIYHAIFRHYYGI